MNSLEDSFYVVKVKRPNKVATFKLFKWVTPALRYRDRALREKGATATLGSFAWRSCE